MAKEKIIQDLSEEAKKVLEMVENMSVIELASLVKVMEEKFGVSASAPLAIAATPASDVAPIEAKEEKTIFDVELTDTGAQKLAVIKAVRELNSSLGLVDAKNLVESAPKIVLQGAKKEDAEGAKTKLETAGAKVTLK